MENEIPNLLITIVIQEPAPKQRLQDYLLQAKRIEQEASSLRKALLHLIDHRFDLSELDQEVEIVIRYKRTGKHKLDYSNIASRRVRVAIKKHIEGSMPFVF